MKCPRNFVGSKSPYRDKPYCTLFLTNFYSVGYVTLKGLMDIHNEAYELYQKFNKPYPHHKTKHRRKKNSSL